MTKQKNYKKTLVACYLGFVTQAISANFAPLLFLTFKNTYGITLDKISMIPMVFYLTQLLVDLAATKFADKIGYRTCVVASQVLSAVGLVLMAILPEILPVPFIGILISVVLYAIGSGLVEVLVSPIVEACPRMLINNPEYAASQEAVSCSRQPYSSHRWSAGSRGAELSSPVRDAWLRLSSESRLPVLPLQVAGQSP